MTPKVRLVWHDVFRLPPACSEIYVELVTVDDEDRQIDTADLEDYPGDYTTPDPYIDAENAVLERNGFTRDDVAEIVTPW